MRVMVDQETVEIARPTLAAAIAGGAAHAESKGRIVVEVKADGVTLAERDIENAPDIPGAFREIQLLTASRAHLAAQVLQAAASALDDVIAAHRFVADQIFATRLEPATNALQETLGVWQQIREGVEQVCVLLASDLPTLSGKVGKSEEARELVSGLSSGLGEVRRAVAAQDWSTLADTLTDDLTVLADRWRTLLGALAAALYTEGE